MMFARKDKLETVLIMVKDIKVVIQNMNHRLNQHHNIVRENILDVEQQVSKENQLRRGGYSSEIAEKVNAETQRRTPSTFKTSEIQL